MGFLNPWGLLALGMVPVILLMYLLKQKHKEITVPSLLFWERTLKMSKSYEPWQKLRRNLLMFLQILAAIFLALALANPFFAGVKKSENILIILDNSLSMNAQDEQPSRLEKAKEEIKALISSQQAGSTYSLLVLGQPTFLALNRCEEKEIARNTVEDITPSFGGYQEETARTLLDIWKEETGGQVYFFGDKAPAFEIEDANWTFFGSSTNNAAITMMSRKDQQVLVKVENYGQDTALRRVSLYDGELLVDYQDVSLEGGQTINCIFEGVQAQNGSLTAKLDQEDILPLDDSFSISLGTQEEKRGLLFSQGNIFLEKSIAAIENVSLALAPLEAMEKVSGYDFYIFDGVLPENLPTDGALFLLNPPSGNDVVEVGAEIEPGQIKIEDTALFAPIESVDFLVGQARQTQTPLWAKVAVSDGQVPLIMYGEKQNQKICVTAFDLHHSDFPLQKEFPIFIYRLMEYFFPSEGMENPDRQFAQSGKLNLWTNAVSAVLIFPSGKEETLQILQENQFAFDEEIGKYTLIQTDAQGQNKISSFYVNPKTEGESNLLFDESAENTPQKHSFTTGSISLRAGLLLLLLCLLLAEWWVSCRES